MSGDEPRRSGRATKGQHNKHESEEPVAKPGKKGGRKGKTVVEEEPEDDDDDEDAEVIRCICGNEDREDKRAFIACDACSVWQHNVCMGVPEDDDDVPDHYFCERCRPEEHQETLQALENDEKIWEVRNKLWQNEKKKGKGRKSKGGDEKPAWLKKDLQEAEHDTQPEQQDDVKEINNKRKRAIKEESEQPRTKQTINEKSARAPRQDKRRKADRASMQDPDTALVDIDKLPADRFKIAKALSSLIADDIKDRVESKAYKISAEQTADSLGEYYGTRIEYSMHINHGGTGSAGYGAQFRTLNANLKKNKTLIQELLAGHLTPDELSTMSSSDMASEELQKERAALKAEADRQNVIDTRDDGPRYRRTHKGDEIVEGETAAASSAPIARPVRQDTTDADMVANPVAAAGSPTEASEDRRASKDNFDMKDIWAKTGADTQTRPIPARRRSTNQTSNNGTKVDADVDRLLADDDDDEYAPDEFSDGIVWRGKIVHTTGDLEPTVNARWVAGRDVTQTIPWKNLLADKLNIDGRLQIQKAEEYLCGLQWSKTSDVSVLALTPYDDATSFNSVFDYFKSRQRYAVVNKDKPAQLVKDLYIIPVDPDSKLPEHIEMLEHCTLKRPVEEKMLLATFVVSRAPIESPVKAQSQILPPADMNGHHMAHMRTQSTHGPAASPINVNGPHFAPGIQSFTSQGQLQGPGVSHFPRGILPGVSPEIMQMAVEVLAEAAYCETAQKVLATPGLAKVQIEHMKKIFDEHPETCVDFDAFAAHLYSAT